MLTNAEYGLINGCPTELPAEFESFAMFTIELPEGGDLWAVTDNPGLSLTELKKIQTKEAELDRQAKLAMYIKQGYAFECPEDEGDDDA